VIFSVLECISYTKSVYIIPLSGTHHQKEPLRQQGSRLVVRTGLCSFLYILDMTGLSQDPGGRRMYKKPALYTYVKV